MKVLIEGEKGNQVEELVSVKLNNDSGDNRKRVKRVRGGRM